ncbi:MAG: DUF4175 domain-containing protein [Sphingobacteriaceae bacterium]|nr:DUF4175 domain-containing protein [Sphingobacteriaceae bacterium]
MQQQQNILIEKLDEFVRKYYKNQLLKGLIYSGGILLSAFLTVVLLEYFGEFNSVTRAILFFGFLSAVVLVLIKYITIPLLKLNKIGNIISYDQAADIIGSHFNSVQDKLLNVLQLQNNQLLNGSDDLLLAGINQKIKELEPVPFSTAIDLSENKKYLKYIIPLLLFSSALFILWPQVIAKSTARLVNYSTYYEKEMPFEINLLNDKLEALQTKDFTLNVEVKGNQLPAELYINIKGIEYKLEKESKSNFYFTFKNPQDNTPFHLNAAGFDSKEYELKVLPKPTLLQFNLQLIYPAYLQKNNERLTNSGDLQIPQGTKVVWTFNTKNTDDLYLRIADSVYSTTHSSMDLFTYGKRFMESSSYSIKAVNQKVKSFIDSVNYSIRVMPDQYPIIEVSEKKDSLETGNVYFSGQVKDDYGFTRLNFHYKKYSTDSSGKTSELSGSNPINIDSKQITQPYYYFLDANRFELGPGDKIEYYFEVYDNDGVNGAKSAKTQLMVFKAPTKDEINEATSKNNNAIKEDLEESIKKAKQLQKDVNEMAKKMNEKKQLGYEEKKKIEELIKKQNELRNKVDEVKQQNQLNNQQQNQFSQTDENILEKQKQLEQLFENVMTPEMKKLFDELNKLMEKMDRNEIQQKLDELKLTNEDIEKELDRNLEAFKQLEVQQKMQNAIDKLDELKNKENELAKETEQAAQDKKENKNEEKSKELEKKQDAINKEFDKLKEELKDIEKKNSELEEPMSLPKNDTKKEEISKDLEKSSESLKKNKKENASKSQKEAGEKMNEMKEDMEKSMEEEESQQQEENAEALRQILENLLNLSYAQEELVKELPKTRIDNPLYVKIPQVQNKLKDDSKIIEDSLLALSKRAPQISAIVNREINAINLNMDKTVKSLAERNTSEATIRMQSTMTSVNNLALLLNESLEQMKEQMKQQQKMQGMPGKGKCKKPGSGSGKKPSDKPGMPNMRQLQEQLNQQLEQLKKALENGKKPGDKPGDKKGPKPGEGGLGKNGQPSMIPGSSEQLAKMAAQQEAIRRQIAEMMSKLKDKGGNPGGEMMEMMEQTEKDIVNRQISNETMKRQQQILTKLLESEKAEREREQDEQRKSNEAKNENLSNPAQFLEYKRLKEKELELLNTVPPGLTPYYKEKVNNYFNNVNGAGQR